MKLIMAMMLMSLGCISATAEEITDRPPGVPADQWIKVSETLGIVTVPRHLNALAPAPSKGGVGTIILPPLEGYLMVRLPGGWKRLNVVEPPAVGPGGNT